MPVEAADIRVIVASPASATHAESYSPFVEPNPQDLLFVGFCKTVELRSELLERLRTVAKAPPPAESESESAEQELAARYVSSWRNGDTGEALVAAVEWWARLRRRPYHAYSLKADVGPYRSSFLVAFDEPDADTMRFNLARALDILERERARVMDFFGWDRTTEGF